MEQLRTVLVLDDNKVFLDDFVSLMGRSFKIFTAQTEKDALSILGDKKVDIMLLDLILSEGIHGLDVLKRVKEMMPDFPVIMLTAYASVETAVESMRCGAYDYISKSPKIEELKAKVEKALAERELKRDYELLREEVKRVSGRIVGMSPAMQRVYESIQRVAMTDVTVLITGESGTGKELVAREIYAASRRNQRVFVAVNCGSLVKDLIESELFGHQKGSFTGAIHTKLGKFELADGGTIFLDEIADLDINLQVKLLRVLQEKEIDRIGGSSPIPVNVRVLAATNRDLAARTESGEFRQDLFYRLNVYPIHLPPLREHKEDIPQLVDHFLRRFSKELSRPVSKINLLTLEYLTSYNWPGNVRELENVLQRAILLAGGRPLEPEHLPKELLEQRITFTGEKSLSQIEKEAKEAASRMAIFTCLEKTDWNIRESAQILGIPEKTLYDKCSKLGIKLSKKKSH
ncbi:MAG: sigma-54 dependent transcriptional regulator [bacterium]